MRLPALTLVTSCLVLVAAIPVRPPADDPSRPATNLSQVAVEPPTAVVGVGDLAPDVAWDGPAGRPQRLRDLRAQGHVLLLFFPDESHLVALERERDRLIDLRVVPAAVVQRGSSAAAALARRLSLHYTLVPDPRLVVAGQFNAVDRSAGRGVPCWFVLDRWGNVRSLGRGSVPGDGFARLASNALLLPGPDAALPARLR